MTLDGMLRESRWKVLNSTNTAASKTAKQAKMRAPDTHRMLMVPIPPGTFMMGSEDGDPDEKPMHQVELTKPFWISAHEVRIVSILNWLNSPGVIREEGWIELRSAQTQCPIKWNGEAYVLNTQSQYGQSQNQPMVYISQKGAKAFCNWLTSQSNNGYKYRLPTEAEWEYAARAGSTTRYPLRDVLDQFATNCSHGPSVTEDCGRYCPNAWGLYDTVGNVSEWCADWYAADYYSSSPAQNPQGPPEAPEVVVRSGNWVGLEFGARSTDRNHFRPDALWQVLGFRVVAELK
jgi:formylglycine-generating enzyme required for sulfatase activity